MTDKETWLKQRARNALNLAEGETDPAMKQAYRALCSGLQRQALVLELARKQAVLKELGIPLQA